MIADDPPWLRNAAAYALASSRGVQASSSSRAPPPEPNPSPKKHAKRIKPLEEARTKGDPLPEGCVDLFVAESESSEDEPDQDSLGGKNVWRKMRGRLKSDIQDFTANRG